jgi:hypothetical protein
LLTFIFQSYSAEQTLYEYYTSGGIKSGLKADSEQFTLNGKHITIFSGSLHYFRVPHQNWNSTLLKFKAAGLNAVQFYSPWNLHEETPGNWDFESSLLNLKEFLIAIKANDLFAVYRPGPYICAEWEMGGFPAWLLRDQHMNLRTDYKPYLDAVEKYYLKVISIVKDFQFSVNGGPIIALQIENEYGGAVNKVAINYLTFLKDTVQKHGFKELLFTSDPGSKARTNPMKNFSGILETANLNTNALATLTELRKNQPNKPLYVSEFWPGWFDQWGDKSHHTMTIEHFEKEVSDTIFKANSSINFYMFIGGTNFGFMNGGHVTTSYDYNAPLSETGNYTDKYWKAKELFEKFNKERKGPQIIIPKPPVVSHTAHYGSVKPIDFLSFNDILSKIKIIDSEKPKYMEMINIGTNYGQNFGFILYRTSINKTKELKLTGGVSDRGIVLIDGKQAVVVSEAKDFVFTIPETLFNSSLKEHTLDILVENTGRVNGGSAMNKARKGLNGDVVLDGKVHSNYKMFPLEFKQKFVESLKSEKGRKIDEKTIPALFRAELDIKGTPMDTFLKLDNWQKGQVFVNGFNIGRYYHIGPQHTLYIPGHYLKTGKNDIYIFELHSSGASIEFVDKPILG